VGLVYLVQHAEKRSEPGDPELTERGRRQASQAARWLSRLGLHAVFSSPLRRAWQTAAPIAAATRRFVRRQRSWFRRDDRINWLDCQRPDLLDRALGQVLDG